MNETELRYSLLQMIHWKSIPYYDSEYGSKQPTLLKDPQCFLIAHLSCMICNE